MSGFGGGFGKPAGAAPAAGGFGAPPAGGAPPAAGGFGGGAGFGAKPATGGFGTTGTAPATGGFGGGAGAATGGTGVGGFGAAPKPGGFGGGGFGSTAGTTGGFGAGGGAAATTGAAAGIDPNALRAMDITLIDNARGSVTGRYLVELEHAYNAVHPGCKFRTFAYNMCTEGQAASAIASVRYSMQLLGGGPLESDWIVAQKQNPDKQRMAPYPIHFMSGLKARADKQVEHIATLHKFTDGIEDKLALLKRINRENEETVRALTHDSNLIERKILLATARVETLRNKGTSMGDERTQIGEKASWLLSQLRSSGRFKAALAEIQPYVDSATYARTQREQELQLAASNSNAAQTTTTTTTSSTKDGAKLTTIATSKAAAAAASASRKLSSTVDPTMVREWNDHLEKMDKAISKLKVLVDSDMQAMQNVKQYIDRDTVHTY